ncbi:MAG: Transcriptional regulator, IclR family, partial [uncultured Rubrobacteraceae bacterium]
GDREPQKFRSVRRPGRYRHGVLVAPGVVRRDGGSQRAGDPQIHRLPFAYDAEGPGDGRAGRRDREVPAGPRSGHARQLGDGGSGRRALLPADLRAVCQTDAGDGHRRRFGGRRRHHHPPEQLGIVCFERELGGSAHAAARHGGGQGLPALHARGPATPLAQEATPTLHREHLYGARDTPKGATRRRKQGLLVHGRGAGDRAQRRRRADPLRGRRGGGRHERVGAGFPATGGVVRGGRRAHHRCRGGDLALPRIPRL